jgi:hypothetical protein
MNSGLRIFIALVSASLAAPALYGIYIYFYLAALGSRASGLEFVLAIAWLVCMAHLVLLGLPIFLVLRRRDRLTWATVPALGFLAGSLPLGVLAYPSYLPGYSSGANWHGRYVTLYENGEPTRYAWLGHVETCLSFGILGAVAALVFWRVWSALGSSRAHAPDA